MINNNLEVISMANEIILVVDDDEDIRTIITLYLRKEGYKIVTATTGNEAIALLNATEPDLIILDLMLPDIDGIEVCSEIRKTSTVPIIFLSCKAEPCDKSYGLIAGGDDYMSKPFESIELVARIKALLRRSIMVQQGNDQIKDHIITLPNLTIDLSSYVVIANGQEVAMAPKEFQLLVLLAQNPNVVFSNEQLYESIWGFDSLGDYRTVMVHISNIRRKIDREDIKNSYIQTIKGVGYKLTI